MVRRSLFIITFLVALVLFSCSKRTHPSKTTEENVTTGNDSTLAKKAPVRHITKAPLPKVIIVNDSAAHKSVDGRYYYDVMGHRYWRNNKDGKYYLFNKSMYNDPAFKSPN